MRIHEWCVAVLKGRSTNMRLTELFQLCTKHYQGATFESADALRAALAPYGEYIAIVTQHYDYVTLNDDGQPDAPVVELAKEVLRTHDNRYTLEVLWRRMQDRLAVTDNLDLPTLKAMLAERNCFTLEDRSLELVRLQPKGETLEVEPLRFKAKVEHAVAIDLTELTQTELRQLKRAIVAELRKRAENNRELQAERRENRRIERLKTIIDYYQVTDATTVEQLFSDRLITKREQMCCMEVGLVTVGMVYAWVIAHELHVSDSELRKLAQKRLVKIAAFHDPELARLIPIMSFPGIRRAQRGMRSND